MENEKISNDIVEVIKGIFLLIYYITFLIVAYNVYLIAKSMDNANELSYMLNGIFGAVVLVYPFNVFRYGFTKTLEQWMKWLFISFLLCCLSLFGGSKF